MILNVLIRGRIMQKPLPSRKKKRYKYKYEKILKALPFVLILLFLVLSYRPISELWSKPAPPLSGFIIVLDPGHGGLDCGATSKNGIEEKDITLSIGKYLRDYLNEVGATVIMTREIDKDLAGDYESSNRKRADLINRANFANINSADIFISIHANSITSEKWSGAQTFYNSEKEDNKLLSKYIQEQLIKIMGNTDRIPLPRNDLVVLKNVEMTSALVEVGFLSNPIEEELLGTSEYQEKLAYAIYQGILAYYVSITNVTENDY